jgi:hypothetical protein
MSNNQKWTSINYSFTQPYPTYSWGLFPNEWVYTNSSMMEAIECSLESMDSFPDAERIINKIKNSS